MKDRDMSETANEILIQAMLKKLVDKYLPEKVILFGSYAHGNPSPDSDLDVLVIKSTRDSFIDRCTAVRRILSDPNRLIPMDILVLTPEELSDRLSLGDQFLQKIVDDGRVLHAA